MGEEIKPTPSDNDNHIDIDNNPTRSGTVQVDYASPNMRHVASCTGFKHFDFNMETIEAQNKPPVALEVDRQGEEQVSEQKKERVLRGWVLLNEGISRQNFYYSWLFTIYVGFNLISFSTLEPQYLSSVLKVPTEVMGGTTATLYLIDYTVRLLFANIVGSWIDVHGRKFVMGIGIVLLSLGYLLIPLLSYDLYTGYVVGKSFISCGIIAICMLPFSADYIDNSTKGVITGFNFGTGFIGGAISGILIKSLLLMGCSYKIIYFIHFPIVLIAGFIYRSGIKGGNTYYKVRTQNNEVQVLDFKTRWGKVARAYKEIPWVSIGVIFGILGNTDFYIMTTGLMIWLKSMLPVNEDPTLIATTYQVLFFGLSVVTTVTCALKIDKVPHMRIIFPVLIVAAAGFFIFPFIPSPHHFLLYLFFVIEGLSLPGVFVFSTYLSIRYNPSDIRGTMSGISNSVGFFGAIIILCLGGYLHDHWRTDASFILYGGLLVLTLISVIIIYFATLRYASRSPNDKENVRLAEPEPIAG